MIERALDHDRPGERAFPDADTSDAPLPHGNGLQAADDMAPLPAGAASVVRAAASVGGDAGRDRPTVSPAGRTRPQSAAHAVPHPGTASRSAARWPGALCAKAHDWLNSAGIATGRIDAASLQAALFGGLAYVALACLSLMLTSFSTSVSPVWLANACVVAVLMRLRVSNELPLLFACFVASMAANELVQQPDAKAVLFSFANMVEIGVVLAMSRGAARARPDMNRIDDLARFIWAGGLIGPLVSALIVAPAMGSSFGDIRAGMMTWFLTDSMAMLLIVPMAMLLADRLSGQLAPAPARPLESVALLSGGIACACLVFNQSSYPLMFLIQPVTLLHAFRLGSLGSAANVVGVALAAGIMTWMGNGPIAAASGGGIAQLHLLQAFIAANFLTGLPVAAILAGRDRMMGRLEAGKREIDLLADNITDAVMRFDLDGICNYASPSVADVMGFAPEHFLGQHASARLHPESLHRATEAMDRLLAGESERERVTYRRFADAPDGSPVFIESDCALVRNRETSAPEAVVIAARDVTERVELELLLTRARRHAENAARAKSEFLANMSHEIRTPMNGVLGFAELMLQGDLEHDQRRFAELIVQSGRSMMMLLNDVLDLSKIESGQFSIDHAPVDLHASLAECAALHRPAANRKGVTLDLLREGGADGDCDDTDPPWILTDGLRLRQIMLNLIGNAVKFTPAGQIRVTYRIGRSDVRLSVTDTGIGISPLQLDAIFHPFTQGQTDSVRTPGGTGLGLSISRQLASLLGGRIEVDSTPGEGSRFTLVLPAALTRAPVLAEDALSDLAVPDLAVPHPAAPARLDSSHITPSRILLVEDHDINRLLVTEMLERCGQDVDVAHDGNEALAMVIDQIMRGRPYDLVLMDIQMPDCDGLEATRAIRAEGIGPGLLPVIALTANAFPEDVTAARAAGMQAHLAKPVVFAQLARILQRWLPTRIVEAEQPGSVPQVGGAATPTARASQLARSPQLVARWQARRDEAVAAVAEALAEGWLTADAEASDELARLLHKLAGTAAMFGEPVLGEAAGMLERALKSPAAGLARIELAEAFLATADAADGDDHGAVSDQGSYR